MLQILKAQDFIDANRGTALNGGLCKERRLRRTVFVLVTVPAVRHLFAHGYSAQSQHLQPLPRRVLEWRAKRCHDVPLDEALDAPRIGEETLASGLQPLQLQARRSPACSLQHLLWRPAVAGHNDREPGFAPVLAEEPLHRHRCRTAIREFRRVSKATGPGHDALRKALLVGSAQVAAEAGAACKGARQRLWASQSCYLCCTKCCKRAGQCDGNRLNMPGGVWNFNGRRGRKTHGATQETPDHFLGEPRSENLLGQTDRLSFAGSHSCIEPYEADALLKSNATAKNHFPARPFT
mmetsp:Transcript_33005/g.91147  ORF Transcript_33005/g.91147 Transcript_33005/m.91147 type:complete len:294 (-) Transcript_33005:759-1640(-)